MASSLADGTGARFNELLKGLQEEFQLQSSAANSSRPTRFNVYLRRLKGEFDIMSLELGSFQKEREDYEAIIDAQAKELDNVRHKTAVCERCGEGATSARGNLVSSQTTLDKPGPTVSDTSAGVSSKNRSTQPTTFSYKTIGLKFRRVTQSQSTNLPSPLVQSISNDQVKKAVDVETVHTLPHPTRSIWRVKFSRDGKYVAAGCTDGKAYIYDVQTGKSTCILQVAAAKHAVWALCFSHDGHYLATASSSDFCFYIWDINTKMLRKTFGGHTLSVYSLDFSPDGQLLLSASGDNTIRLWNDDSLVKKLIDDEFSGIYTSAVFSPDGKQIVASRSTGMVKIWDVDTGQLVKRVKAHVKQANSVGFMPDGEGLFSCGDMALKFWDVSSLSRTYSAVAPVRVFSGHKGRVSSLAISPDGRLVASGSDDQSVRIWDTTSGDAAEQCNLPHKSDVWTVDFSPAGDYLAAGRHDGTVVIWRYSHTASSAAGASGLDGSDQLPPYLP